MSASIDSSAVLCIVSLKCLLLSPILHTHTHTHMEVYCTGSPCFYLSKIYNCLFRTRVFVSRSSFTLPLSLLILSFLSLTAHNPLNKQSQIKTKSKSLSKHSKDQESPEKWQRQIKKSEVKSKRKAKAKVELFLFCRLSYSSSCVSFCTLKQCLHLMPKEMTKRVRCHIWIMGLAPSCRRVISIMACQPWRMWRQPLHRSSKKRNRRRRRRVSHENGHRQVEERG